MIQSAQKKASTYKQGLVVIICAIPVLTFPPNACSSLYCPWAYPTQSLVGPRVHFHWLCKFRTCSLLIFLHPAVLGVPCARGQHLPGHFLSAAWLWLLSASASHLCQDLPSSTGCPQLLSLGFALGTWCCIVSLECLLSLLGQVSL